MDAPFHGGSNDTISGGGVLVHDTQFVILQREQHSGIIVTSGKLITQCQ
jgi:hypothetical protein